MKPLIDEYKSIVNRTMDIVCKAQTWVSVISAVTIWLLSEKINTDLGRVAVVLTLLSIPSLAQWGKRKIKRYEDRDWRTNHSKFDFSGTWDTDTRFVSAIKVVASEPLPPEQEGFMIVSQTPFELRLNTCQLKSKTSLETLGGWSWLAASASDDGKYVYTAYEMDDLPDLSVKTKRSHGVGFERIVVLNWEGGDPQKRPTLMKSYWYDCVREDQNQLMYIGETTYRRRTLA